jgi:FMN-dependent oxidoreductase (nitrilotriacetate monooxygenase family)
MGKEIRLNAFEMNCAGHLAAGLWRHPRDISHSYTSLEYWTELARTLERGKFDGLFLADVLGVYDVYAGNHAAALRNGTQTPVDDPVLTIPAMAHVTKHLGFGVTCISSFEPPYPFARRMTTLDHLTNGRIGWNIVTGYLDSAAKGMGLEAQNSHDLRYDIADEYMEVVYKLWEGSWEDDAVIRDRASGIFARPEKIHRIKHHGQHYRVDAIHLSEPSPQRTPVLYQAGSSPRGREFAARHAECVFVSARSERVTAHIVSDIRRRAQAHGRDPSDILVFSLMTTIVGRTDAEAQRKFEDYRHYASPEGALALFSGWTGVDFSQYSMDEPVRDIKRDAVRTMLEGFARDDSGKVWTVRDVAEYVAVGSSGPLAIGSPQTVADRLQAWIEETAVDGFNLAYAVRPETFVDFVEMVVPELQRRGVFKTEYREGTLREKLYGRGRARLPASHPAAAYRRGSWSSADKTATD